MTIPQTELAMRGSNGVGLEGAMKPLRECSRHAFAKICGYLRYLLRVALVSCTPNGRSRHFRW